MDRSGFADAEGAQGAGEYGEALNRGPIDQVVEYHDSRGHIAYVGREVERMQAAATTAEDKGLIARFRDVLARAQRIVAPLPPETAPRASVGEYRAIAADAVRLARR